MDKITPAQRAESFLAVQQEGEAEAGRVLGEQLMAETEAMGGFLPLAVEVVERATMAQHREQVEMVARELSSSRHTFNE
jgi:hypothetical protein